MAQVIAVKLIDGTPIGKWYEIGSPVFISPTIGMKKVSDIDFIISPTSRNVIVRIHVEGELYCTYENLPYNTYFETKFHEISEAND